MNLKGLGVYINDKLIGQPDEIEIQYTARRKGKVYFKVYFKVRNHPYIKSGYADDEETYKLFKGVKRGLKLQGKVTMQG